MKAFAAILFAVLLLAVASPAFADTYTFDSDNEGWLQTYVGRPDSTWTYDTLYTNSSADWIATGGNTAGHIYQTVGTDIKERAYWMGKRGPDNMLGDLTGLSLQTDIWSTDNWVTLADGSGGDDGNVYARWVIANKVNSTDTYNMFVSTRAASIDLNDLTGWETHSVDLVEANFFRWPVAGANSQTFAQVLSDYDQIGLYVFSGTDTISNINGGSGTWGTGSVLSHYGAVASSGEATWGLDNLGAVTPEPGTFVLLGAGLVALGLGRRRRRWRA